MPECPVCGSSDGCKFVGGQAYLYKENHLSVDDWRRIYRFVKYQWLPFLHQVVHNARQRPIKLEKEQSETMSMRYGEMIYD
jgi:hypothetical protein